MFKKIGVVGDKDSVLAFKALGIDVFSVTNNDEAKRIGTYVRYPERSELNAEINESLIVEFYSRV